jgi:hypothetical protein
MLNKDELLHIPQTLKPLGKEKNGRGRICYGTKSMLNGHFAICGPRRLKPIKRESETAFSNDQEGQLWHRKRSWNSI